ncbi:hypothetical protein [Helicobacter pylori]|uniref:hypothetical protein n=1 Tax=Helicobacter pylori TaxID=210 RepID=UPI000EAD59F3|nr:hypothetical protein [Helicobacter pylori]
MRDCKQIFNKGLKPYDKHSVCLKSFLRLCFLKFDTYKQRSGLFLTLIFYAFFNACKVLIPIIDFRIILILKYPIKPIQRVSNAY